MSALPLLVIFTGLPGTGKTSISQHISQSLNLPLMSRDTIKEIMYDQIGIGDKAWSGKLSRATFDIMEYMIEEQLRAGHGLILESNYMSKLASPYFTALQQRYPFHCVQVVCQTELDILTKRAHERGLTDTRHPGHNDRVSASDHRKNNIARIQNGEDQPLEIPDSFVITVDTTDFTAVNMDNIAKQIHLATL